MEEVEILTNLIFFCEGDPSQYKIVIEPPKNRTGYTVQWFNFVENALILDEEKAIKKNYFDPTKSLNLLQESYFIYDCSSLVKPYFISELNKFLPIYCSVSNFSEKKKKKNLKLFWRQIKKDFFIENST